MLVGVQVPPSAPNFLVSHREIKNNEAEFSFALLLQVEMFLNILAAVDAGWSSLVARRAHNPKVVGSNPAPATSFSVTGYNSLLLFTGSKLNDLVITGFFVIWNLKNVVITTLYWGYIALFCFSGGYLGNYRK